MLAQITSGSPLAAEAVMIRADAAIEAAPRAELASAAARRTDLPITDRGHRRPQCTRRPERHRPRAVPPAQLLVGHCHELLGDRQAATAQLDRLRRSRFGRPEGLAATLWMGDLAREEGRADEALDHYRRTLQQAGPREAYHNPWLPLPSWNPAW